MKSLRTLWYEFRETRDEAWADGYNTAEADYEPFVADKDAFIAEQSAIIEQCMTVFDQLAAWRVVPESLQEKLAGYV